MANERDFPSCTGAGNDGPSSREDEHADFSSILPGDTQVIESQSHNTDHKSHDISLSQPTRLLQIRELGHSEENRIVDSSCDIKGDEDTQELLAAGERTTRVAYPQEKNDEQDDQCANDTIGERETQPVSGSNDVVTQVDNSSLRPDASLPLTHLKLTESPWLNHLKNTQASSDTPWLSKIKDPFNETPINNRLFNSLLETPNSNERKSMSFDTPTAAHNIFQKLRDNQAGPELEVDTQSVPNLMFDSPTQNTQPLETQSQESVLSSSHLLRLHDNVQNDTIIIDVVSNSNSVPPVVHGAFGPSSRLIPPTQIVHTSSSSQAKSRLTGEKALDGSQEDVQVPGTAPDNVQPMEQSELEQDHLIDPTQKLLSSPIVSDEEPSVIEEDSKGDGYQGPNENELTEGSSGNKESMYVMVEDSIQKFHRDLTSKAQESSQKITIHANSTDSNSQENESPSIFVRSQLASRFASAPVRLGGSSQYIASSPSRPRRLLKTQSVLNKTGASKEPMSPPMNIKSLSDNDYRHASDDDHFGDLANDVTQDISDIDEYNEDESRVENTVMEEVDMVKSGNKSADYREDDGTYHDEDDENLMVALSRRRNNQRKRKTPIIPDGPIIKRSKSSLGTDFSQDFLAASQKSFKHDITSSLTYQNTSVSSTQDADNNVFPLCTLRSETKELTEEDRVFKRSVWCFFNADYYPGVVISHDNDGVFSVRFAESVDEISVLYPLDLRIGDHVEVAKKEYLVTGLGCTAKDRENDEVIRCMRGYDTVIGKRIKGRGKKRKIEDLECSFPISIVKILAGEWFKRSRLGMDLELKPRRGPRKDVTGPVMTYKKEFMNSTPRKVDNDVSSSLFSDCLFVITGIDDSELKPLTELIEKHSGEVVHDGFSSLIRLESQGDSKVSVRAKSNLQGYKFGALISNRYSRSPKYLEALSLGWPMVSEKFIYDSVEDSDLKLDYLTTYLLPAGESKRLRFVKSANILRYLNNLMSELPLSQQIHNNRLLEGRQVLLTSGNPEIIKFIFFTLGAHTVKKIKLTNHSTLISEIHGLIKSEVASDNSPVLIYHEKLTVLKQNLNQIEPSSRHKFKQSKKTVAKSNGILNRALTSVKVELIDWEWVVQCLIDGYPWTSEQKTLI